MYNHYKKKIKISLNETKVWENISWQTLASENKKAEWQDWTMGNGYGNQSRG